MQVLRHAPQKYFWQANLFIEARFHIIERGKYYVTNPPSEETKNHETSSPDLMVEPETEKAMIDTMRTKSAEEENDEVPSKGNDTTTLGEGNGIESKKSSHVSEVEQSVLEVTPGQEEHEDDDDVEGNQIQETEEKNDEQYSEKSSAPKEPRDFLSMVEPETERGITDATRTESTLEEKKEVPWKGKDTTTSDEIDQKGTETEQSSDVSEEEQSILEATPGQEEHGNDDDVEANQIQQTKEKNDDQYSEKLSEVNESIPSKRNDSIDHEAEIETRSSNDSDDGSIPVAETNFWTCRKIFLASLFLALCAGVCLNFFVFNNTDEESKSSISNGNAGSGSLTRTKTPTWIPTKSPSNSPSAVPTISGAPSISPAPTKGPSSQPSMHPTIKPSNRPTISNAPTNWPTRQPSGRPTISQSPSRSPTNRPSHRPTMTPSSNPTLSQSPSESPSNTPSRLPSVSPSTSPTSPPTRSPTQSPTPAYYTQLTSYLENDFGIQITSENANQTISQIVEEAEAGVLNEMLMTPKIVQRYALINMELALFGSNSPGQWGSFKQDECTWTGITCNGNREVTDIRLLGKDLQGSIPSEIGLLKALAHLDLASNNLQGSIPEELYKCLSLQKIFLYQNRLSGTISDKIIDLWDLKEFNLSSNQISGRIPTTMRSTGRGIYRIGYFNVYDNQMTGPMIAEGSRLRQLFYLDLGRNRFSGTIPPMDEYIRLRHLYLDHNQFSGQLPENIVNTGDDRLNILAVNDNRFTGRLPGEHTFINELMQFTAQNNRFTSMNDRTCKLSVTGIGESPEFKSDCDICVCGKDDLFCKYCYN